MPWLLVLSSPSPSLMYLTYLSSKVPRIFCLFATDGEVVVGWGVSCLGAGVGVCVLGLGHA